MSNDPVTLVWFRQDLRISDNPALHAAAENGPVLPIFILDDEEAGDWAMGAASRAWLHHSLASLDRELGGGLQFFSGNAAEIIDSLAARLPLAGVYWNRCYEPWRRRRDAEIRARIDGNGIDVRSFNASLLWEPWDICKNDGSPYRVFTPFYQKGCLSAAPPRQPLPPPAALRLHKQGIDAGIDLERLGLLPREDWHRGMMSHWEVGEDAAHRRLEEFCRQGLEDYRAARDFPARDGTSRLSPHLHFGELSPHQAWQRISQAEHSGGGPGAAAFLRELAWREFSYSLMYHFPDLPEKNFNPRFDSFEWLDNASGLEAWRRAETGFPLVDAGLRELWQTGYMHNRVRMVVASFLIKNMLVHWRTGEEWFWDCLVDADLANNSASWQWCAGSGADAAPYFRIFNPVLQSEKFDPDGEYLARYCPELARLPARLRHKPWEAPADALRRAGLRLGVDYPQPILDLKTTRERALERFRALDR